MRDRSWRIVFPMLLVLAIACARVEGRSPRIDKQAARVAPPAVEATSENPNVDGKALGIFDRMARYLSTAPALSVVVESGYDAVQRNGMKIEFGETRTITLRRPDRLRVDTEDRDGSRRGIRFDGRTIGVFDTDQKVYATVEKPGSMDDALDYFIDQLGMPVPLSELFASDLPEFARNLRGLYYVERATIAGIPTDHLAGGTRNVDFQIWIAQGDQPLPQRLILTYKRDDGEPQRWAQFRNWNLSPSVADSVFAFTPPKGAERIPFAPRKVAAAPATPKGGAR
jgi:hypothetical protein